MSKQFQVRRGNTADNTSFVGAEGEVTFDTQLKRLHIHDGTTVGGIPIAKDSDTVHKSGNEEIAGGKTFTDSLTISKEPTPTLHLKHTTNDSTTTPSENKLCQVLVEDMNDVWTGAFQVSHRDNGSNISQVLVRKQDASESESLAIGYGVNGELFTYAPTPKPGDNSKCIVTTDWINQNRTNCITEIPQDIKVEINETKNFVVKAGTKIYVPNGFEQDGTTRKFDIKIIPEDVIVRNDQTSITHMYFMDGLDDWARTLPERCFSGTTPPTSPQHTDIWYDLSNNVIKRYINDAWSLEDGFSLPLAIISYSTSDQTCKSIDQIFNGFGYIGSTIFALPGVSGLTANGHNADGTYKSTSFTLNSVKTIDISPYTTIGCPLSLNAAGLSYSTHFYEQNTNPEKEYSYWYNPESNYLYMSSSTPTFSLLNKAIVGKFNRTLGVVSDLQIKNTFRSLNYNDTEFIAHQAMPSDRYIDLTLGANESKYTAQADGYFIWQAKPTDGTIGFRMTLMNNTTRVSSGIIVPSAPASNTQEIFIPVSKNDNIQIVYYNLTNIIFRFVYANGAK